MKKNINGFSLIEILVVISIIGFIAAAAFYNYNIARARARDTVRVSDISSLTKAFELYFNENNSYPDPGNGQCINGSSQAAQDMINAQILKSRVQDPLWSDVAPANTNGVIDAGETNFCYYYYGEDDTYLLNYYLETSSEAGDAGPHTITEEGRH